MLDLFRLSEIESLRFTAWATVSLAVLTALLAIGAVINAFLLWRQNVHIAAGLEDGRRQWMDATKPLVVFEHAALLPERVKGRGWEWEGGSPKCFVGVTLRNVGSGPAIDVEVNASIAPLGQQFLDGYDPAQNMADSRAEQLATEGSATHSQKVMVLAPMESREVYLRGPQGVLLEIPLDLAAAVVTASLYFKDVHDRRFYYPSQSDPDVIPVTFRLALIEDRVPTFGS